MIAANVAAAETLERLRKPCMYRVHDAPDPAKLEALREFLDEIGIPGCRWPRARSMRPRHFNQILRRPPARRSAAWSTQLVLRSQAQAVYSPDNIGHFGLALRRYAHFTSPIRRYADLLVHRALIAGHRSARTALTRQTARGRIRRAGRAHLDDRAARRRGRARRHRPLRRGLSSPTGSARLSPARVNGVTRFGLFVTLDETGADGLMPMSSLGGDFYVLR